MKEEGIKMKEKEVKRKIKEALHYFLGGKNMEIISCESQYNVVISGKANSQLIEPTGREILTIKIEIERA